MASAQEAARSRDAAEPPSQALYNAAVAYIALQIAEGVNPDEIDISEIPEQVLRPTLIAIGTLWASIPSRFGGKWPPTLDEALGEVSAKIQELGGEVAKAYRGESWGDEVERLAQEFGEEERRRRGPGRFLLRTPDENIAAFAEEVRRVVLSARDMAREVLQNSRRHAVTVARRVRRDNPEATNADIAAAVRSDQDWLRAAARTMSTTYSAASAVGLVDAVNRAVGENHRVVWISRGDTRVRESHRRLHGKVRKPGAAFKTWPTGQRLAFPGDPRAPLDETINCRCALILVPESTAHEVPDTFHVSQADFDLVASAWKARMIQAEIDLMEEMAEIRRL